jgi:hypothetical protein
MKIIGIEGMTADEVRHEVARGGSFVFYQYCISILVMTFKRSSSIYFIKGGHNRVSKGLPFTLLTFFLGWWGIPWGPIWSIGVLITNFRGGKDVTQAVLASLRSPSPAAPGAPVAQNPIPTQRQKQTL